MKSLILIILATIHDMRRTIQLDTTKQYKTHEQMIHVRCSSLNLDKNTIIYQLSICAQYSTNRYGIIQEDRQSPITHVIITNESLPDS